MLYICDRSWKDPLPPICCFDADFSTERLSSAHLRERSETLLSLGGFGGFLDFGLTAMLRNF